MCANKLQKILLLHVGGNCNAKLSPDITSQTAKLINNNELDTNNNNNNNNNKTISNTNNNINVTVGNKKSSANNYKALPPTQAPPQSFLNPFGQWVSHFGNDQLQTTLQKTYSLFYNAERHTNFQLHTVAQSGRVLHAVSDTIGAAFGVTKGEEIAWHTDDVLLYDAASLRSSRYNPFNPTRIIIHGWLGGAHANVFNSLIPAYLKLNGDRGASHNVFTVDWGRGAVADYITASYRVKSVGKTLAKFVDFLHYEAGTRYEDIHLIGFSMGAHVAGIAGKHVQSVGGVGLLGAIYALDAAQPLFGYEQVTERIDRTDAAYVEVVHTNVGGYGYDRPLGHADFYVNFGGPQPGCYFNECSHFRAFQVFAEALSGTLWGVGCDASLWHELHKQRHCLRLTDTNLTLGGDPQGGAALATQRQGVYYVLTNAKAPYALDKSMTTTQEGVTESVAEDVVPQVIKV